MNRGQLGEKLALNYLIKKGYILDAQNYRTRFGEIDLIMHDKEYLVFVEVKLRKNLRFGMPAEYVTVSKQRKIILAAEQWLIDNNTSLQPRFDVIEIIMSDKSTVPQTINHLISAFDA